MKKKLYLAHPIGGLQGKDVFTYYDNLSEKLSKFYDILSPMVGKNFLRNTVEFKPTGYEHPITKNHAIFQRDTWMVSQSDIIFCDLIGVEKISIGCCMELAIASWLNKHTIVVMDKGNIHNHAFILEAADIVFETFEEGYNYLVELGSTN